MTVQKSTSKNVKVMKDKRRLRNCHRVEEIRGMMTKCNVGPCSRSWSRRKALVETLVAYKLSVLSPLLVLFQGQFLSFDN